MKKPTDHTNNSTLCQLILPKKKCAEKEFRRELKRLTVIYGGFENLVVYVRLNYNGSGRKFLKKLCVEER